MKSLCSYVLWGGMVLIFSAPTKAAEPAVSFTGHVLLLEPTQMPKNIVFVMDAGKEPCPTGHLLLWSSDNLELEKSVYATLLAAITSGQMVDFYVNSDDKNCYGQDLHITNGR